MLEKEGTVEFRLTHQRPDWSRDDHRYKFGPFQYGDIIVQAVKQPDKTVEITIRGPFGKRFTFHRPMPPCENELHVVITWKEQKVNLYLNGKLVETQEITRGD